MMIYIDRGVSIATLFINLNDRASALGEKRVRKALRRSPYQQSHRWQLTRDLWPKVFGS